MGVQLVLGAWRWHAVRRGLGIEATFGNSMRLYSIGSFFSSYVISGVSGDIMRGWLSFKSGIDPARAANSVILDRVVVLVGIAVMMLPAMPWFFPYVGTGDRGMAPALAAGGLFVAVIATSPARRLPASWQATLPGRLARKLGDGMHDVFMRPRAALWAISARCAGASGSGRRDVGAGAEPGIPVQFLDCLIIIQIVAVVNSHPDFGRGVGCQGSGCGRAVRPDRGREGGGAAAVGGAGAAGPGCKPARRGGLAHVAGGPKVTEIGRLAPKAAPQ